MIDKNVTKVMSAARRAQSMGEVCAEIGVSRNFLLGQIRRGQLRARRLGRRVVILSEDLEAYLNNAEQVCEDGRREGA